MSLRTTLSSTGSAATWAQNRHTPPVFDAPLPSDSSGDAGTSDERSTSADTGLFIDVHRERLDQLYLLFRATFAAGILGFVLIDALNALATAWPTLALIVGYAGLNAAIWVHGRRYPGQARWLYAGSDVLLVCVLRHVYTFEALVDPNATMVGLFTLVLVGYVAYSDPRFSAVLSVVAASVTVLSLLYDAILPVAAPLTAPPFARTHPIRVTVLLLYMSAASAITYFLAHRLHAQVRAYGSQLEKRLEAALTSATERTRRERLEELNQLKCNFITILSHELRTPITPLRTALEIVHDEMGRKGQDVELLGIAMDAAARLQRLVQDYTRLAELLTHDRDEMLRWNVRLADLFVVLADNSEMPASRYRIAPPAADLAATTDPRLLGGAILALMRRADLATPSPLQFSVWAFDTGREVVVSVHDPSSYVDPESRADLDDPFAYSSERAYVSPNTGLELVLAQHSIQRIGGSIDIESVRGRGTTISCRVPRGPMDAGWMTDKALRQELRQFAP